MAIRLLWLIGTRWLKLPVFVCVCLCLCACFMFDMCMWYVYDEYIGFIGEMKSQ